METCVHCGVNFSYEHKCNSQSKKGCQKEGCDISHPVFNYEGQKKGKYCSEHKEPGMINVVHKRCEKDGCTSQPVFNYEGQKKGMYCNEHKEPGMIDIVNKRCQKDGCTSRPSFNYEGQKRKYCSEHKEPGMIDVVHKRCQKDGCTSISPKFNYEGQKKGKYCSEHKEPGMIDVVHKRCEKDGCTSISPSFNYEGQKKGKYCSEHKEHGMIDVVHKRCEKDGCTSISPVFNYEGQKKGKYCSEHKEPGMIDVVNKRCKTHLCDIIVSKKYEGYCLFCFINTFPDKPVSRNYKTKERAVCEFVINQFPYDWVSDKRIIDGCSKKRPDLFLDLGYQIIIVEVDETQHETYDCSCENKRLMELSRDVGHRSIVFIRFNPDGYKHNGKNITSCWAVNKKGICVVKKTKIAEWNDRLNSLRTQIQYWIDNHTNKTIETIHLFYTLD